MSTPEAPSHEVGEKRPAAPAEPVATAPVLTETAVARKAAKEIRRRELARQLASYVPDIKLKVTAPDGSDAGTFVFFTVFPGDEHAEIRFVHPAEGREQEFRLTLADYRKFALLMAETLKAAG